MIKTCKDLKVYNDAFDASMKIFELTKIYPKEETYSLTDQIRRSSRSVVAHISEGFAKKRYPSVFVKYLYDSLGSCEETKTWLDYSLACKYLKKEEYEFLHKQYDQISAMIYALIKNWKNYEK